MTKLLRNSLAVLALAALPVASAFAAAPVVKPTPTPAPAATAAAPSPWTAPAAAAATTTTTTTETVATTATTPVYNEAVTYRPTGKSLGIGAGWVFPQTLGTPNIISARFRMEDGLTLEPNVQIDVASGSSKVSGGGASAKGSSSAMNLIVGAAIRKPMYSRSQVDIVGIINPFISITSSSTKPAGGTKVATSTFGLGTGWGVGVEYWPKSQWSISFNALNPLLNIGSTSTKDDAAATTTSATNVFVGADFNPTVQLLTHIYY
jgi:hypothetical protein